jgi:uncharacterized protein YkwD
MGALLLLPQSIHRNPPPKSAAPPPPAFMRARLIQAVSPASASPSARAQRLALAPFTGPLNSSLSGAALELQFVERDRALAGRQPLSSDPGLVKAATLRARDMLSRRYFSHYDPATGKLAYPIALREAGVAYRVAGENIAYSWPSLSMQWANQFFMNTADHRANILNPAFHRVGIAVLSGGGRTVLVELFAN